MKIYLPGEKSKAMCPVDGLVDTTFEYRDIFLSDSNIVVKNILMGVCDQCERVVSMPSQTTPALKAAKIAVQNK